MTFREFTGKNVEEAIRTAMKEYSADLAELDIEILSQGSRGILGVGGEEARILAAPKSAVAAAETVRDSAPEPEPMAPMREASRPAAQAPDEGEPISEQLADLGRSDAPPRRDAGGRSRGGRAGRTATLAEAAAIVPSATARPASRVSHGRTARPASPRRSSRASRSRSSPRRSAARWKRRRACSRSCCA